MTVTQDLERLQRAREEVDALTPGSTEQLEALRYFAAYLRESPESLYRLASSARETWSEMSHPDRAQLLAVLAAMEGLRTTLDAHALRDAALLSSEIARVYRPDVVRFAEAVSELSRVLDGTLGGDNAEALSAWHRLEMRSPEFASRVKASIKERPVPDTWVDAENSDRK